MSKTPEEMAEEYAKDWHKDCDYPEKILKHTIKATKTTFLAGYQAAKDQLRESVIVLEKHRVAAEKAVTNIKNASDWVTIERLEGNSLDSITNLPTSAKWISVKDRLPETNKGFIGFVENQEVCCCHRYANSATDEGPVFYAQISGGFLMFSLESITHWQPLPAPPKEEK